jgi:hypothetical protein
LFDSILFKNRVGPGALIDVGSLAEALIFYRCVAILANTATIKDLLSRIPPYLLLSLVRDERLEIHYLEDQVGVHSEMRDGRMQHALVGFSSPQHTPKTGAREAFRVAAGATSQAKFSASKFSRLLLPASHARFDQANVLQSFCEPSLISCIPRVVERIVPEYRWNEPVFVVHRESQKTVVVESNIDWVALNRYYHMRVPIEHSSINDAYLLALVQGAYEAHYFSAHLDTEVAVDPVEQVVHTHTLGDLLRRQARSSTELGRFEDLTLGQAHAIRAAVNSGRVSFREVVTLLDKADRFRDWLHLQPAESSLVAEFYKATVENTWAEKLPTRATRWGVFTGLGVAADAFGAGGVGSVAGVWLGALDAFVVDKLIKGWKPHQFVEETLKPLVKNSRG